MAVAPGVRPTESRVREALFSIWRERMAGANFLDLFAGSGVVGLEALSRGAGQVRFVEKSRRVASVLQGNAVRLAEGDWELVRAELPGGLSRLEGARFDLIFADPPYDYERYGQLIARISDVLETDGALAVEHSVRTRLPDEAGELGLRDERVYGESAVAMYARRRQK